MRILKQRLSFLFVLISVVSIVTVSPVTAGSPDAEIEYLLESIDNSGCTFVRNWSEYPGDEARSHMEMKLDYAKGKITKTEQFIEHIAAKSSVTGKEYKIICNGKEYSTAAWLTEKLEAYRNGDKSGNSMP